MMLSIQAQVGVALADPEQKVGLPAAKPEPRRAVQSDPATIVHHLMSASEDSRRRGWRQIGVEPAQLRDPTGGVHDLRFLSTNLDADPDREAILTLTTDPGVRVLVFDRGAGGWLVVGDFSSSWHGSDPNRIVQLMGNHVLIRVRNGGTGVATTNLTIYRLANGSMYRLFETTEANEYDTSGPGNAGGWFIERRNVLFVNTYETARRAIVVYHTKALLPPDQSSASTTVCGAKPVACSAYRWDAGTFSFQRARELDAVYCDTARRQPRTNLVEGCVSEFGQ